MMDLCNIKDIKELLSRHGFHFSKSMGQNFLIADWVPRDIVLRSGVGKSSCVLEIGPGIGALTTHLCRQAGKVVAVELDCSLLPVLHETLSDHTNVEVINADILKLDLEQLKQEHFDGLRPVVCANLPYNITSPLIAALMESGCFKQITVMVQREVAKRICAEAGSPDYGAFTVFIRYYANPSILFDVPPDCFIPKPKVTSSVINLDMHSAPPAEIEDKAFFFKTVHGAFAQRRKTLVNALSAAFCGQLGKDSILDVVTSCGFSENIRGERLSFSDFALLSHRLKCKLEDITMPN